MKIPVGPSIYEIYRYEHNVSEIFWGFRPQTRTLRGTPKSLPRHHPYNPHHITLASPLKHI